MVEKNVKLAKLFETLNKDLYRSGRIVELYKPLSEILNNLTNNVIELEETHKRQSHLDNEIETEIKKRELIALYKKMNDVVSGLKEEIDYFSKEVVKGNSLFEEFRTYRTYIFEDSKKSQEYLHKLIDTFNIEKFVLKFNVVGTVDLSEVAQHVNGKRVGVDIVVPTENLKLIYEEVLKSKTMKFRLITDSIVIYFEKDNVLHIEGPSKKIKLCDVNAKSFEAKLLDN